MRNNNVVDTRDMLDAEQWKEAGFGVEVLGDGNMNKKTKVLFVKNITRAFTEKDVELLQKHFDVRVVDFVLSRKNLKGTLKTVLGMIIGALWADVTFSWFADIHAYIAVRLSKIFRKKAIVVASGYSVVDMPEIGYGLMQSPKSARVVKYILERVDTILAVSESNKRDILKYTNNKNVKLIYHGIDDTVFTPKNKKEDLLITVGYVNNSNIKRKGLETFVKSAVYLPSIEFVLIGKHLDDSIHYLKSIATPNVKFAGFVSDDELLKYYQMAKVYVQISAHEGYGMSLAEAMLCECVPVVTNRGAIPEVVGDTGFYVPYDDPKATAEAIKEALKLDKGKEARERIKNMFPIERREKELVEIIRGLIEKRSKND